MHKIANTISQTKSNRQPFFIGSRCGGLILMVVYLLILFPGCSNKAPEYEFVVSEGDKVSIRISEVNDNDVHFYTYRHKDKNINFFVRTDGAGKLHTHFDACYSCFKYKLGFHVEGDHIRCIACNLKYRLADEFWDYVGACAPIPLTSKIKNGFIEIKLAAAQKGEVLF